MYGWNLQKCLVTISEGIVLGSDVLVRVLDALLQRRHVAPVLPVLVPQPVGVGTSGSEGGNTAAKIQNTMISLHSGSAVTISPALCLAPAAFHFLRCPVAGASIRGSAGPLLLPPSSSSSVSSNTWPGSHSGDTAQETTRLGYQT